MNNVNKTLYIPLYGKSYVSQKGLFLDDKKAEEIWKAEGFELKGKSKSKWLAYYMGIRSAVFDDWLKQKMIDNPDAVILHIGCGLDSRVRRVGTGKHRWYDIDFSEVMNERRKYYSETDNYLMLSADIRETDWIKEIPEKTKAIVVMEGVSMYLATQELQTFMKTISTQFEQLDILMDCYTVLAAKMSKYKNPINDVGVTRVYGLDDPMLLQQNGIKYIKEHDMTPQGYIEQLCGMEKKVFEKLYAGDFSKKLYKIYEYEKTN